MNEKIIRVAVPLIPTLIIIICVAAAFATHGWDVKATVLGEQSFQALEIFSPEGFAEAEAVFEVTGFKISEDRTKLMLDAVFHSPLKLPVTIKEMQAEFVLDGSIVVIELPREVQVPPRGSASLTLEGPLPPLTYPPTEQPTPRSMMMTVDVGGIVLQLEELEAGGAR
ncbi:MAG: hypothetical protein EFT35_03450 [Methanophagales archaeon ANME-1-THS]|nr:MAG: hypothetical protein EFT35_03450 [Methanophagales archaeon ANME-1-THS]